MTPAQVKQLYEGLCQLLGRIRDPEAGEKKAQYKQYLADMVGYFNAYISNFCRTHHLEPITIATLFHYYPRRVPSRQYLIIDNYLRQSQQRPQAPAAISTAVSSFMSPGAHFVPPTVRYMPAAPVASPSSGRLPQSAMKTLMSNFLHKLDTDFPDMSSISTEVQLAHAYTALNVWLSSYCTNHKFMQILTLNTLLQDYRYSFPKYWEKGYHCLAHIRRNLPSLEEKSSRVKDILHRIQPESEYLRQVLATLGRMPLRPIDLVIASIARQNVKTIEPSQQAASAELITSSIKGELDFIYGQIKEIQTGITMPAAVSLGSGPSMYGTPPSATSAIPSSEPTPAAATRTVPAPFLCAISGEVMQDPVIGSDGRNYERRAIEAALRENPYIPNTETSMTIDDLYPNRALKELIEAWQSHAESREAPSQYLCFATEELLKEPVIDPDGHTYERTVIEEMIDRNVPSPFTRAPMTKESLRPNHALRDLITTWKQEHPEPAGANSQIYRSS